jgi:acetyl-CoA carboxylase biotin carboxyl carrier protein
VPLAPHPPSAAGPVAAAAIPTTPAPESTRAIYIESPMVGTFYSSSSPDAPSFVSVGATIRADTTVCIIEAMKVFTDIPAGIAGTITEVLVKNGQAVEFGQPIFRIEPA